MSTDGAAAGPRLLTVDELALRWHVSASYLHKLTCRREIPHFRLGRRVCFDIDEVDAWFRARAHRDPVVVE